MATMVNEIIRNYKKLFSILFSCKLPLDNFTVLFVICLSFCSFWCNKGRGMCCPVCKAVHIKIPCSERVANVSSLAEWSFTICPTTYKMCRMRR